jgi:GT2 family glycosyltransferase
MAQLSIITVNFRSAEALKRSLASVATLSGETELEWIVVNNSPEEGARARKLEFPARLGHHLIIENANNAGFGVACNQGSA